MDLFAVVIQVIKWSLRIALFVAMVAAASAVLIIVIGGPAAASSLQLVDGAQPAVIRSVFSMLVDEGVTSVPSVLALLDLFSVGIVAAAVAAAAFKISGYFLGGSE